eukprot:GHVT01013141.1.p1 GENE.GHVT01013141.1~~GHVT01013141.1.p1  ORF type:complete len:633 (+),score=49.53 GHVT01013141.1:790-2688(+)
MSRCITSHAHMPFVGARVVCVRVAKRFTNGLSCPHFQSTMTFCTKFLVEALGPSNVSLCDLYVAIDVTVTNWQLQKFKLRKSNVFATRAAAQNEFVLTISGQFISLAICCMQYFLTVCVCGPGRVDSVVRSMGVPALACLATVDDIHRKPRPGCWLWMWNLLSCWLPRLNADSDMGRTQTPAKCLEAVAAGDDTGSLNSLESSSASSTRRPTLWWCSEKPLFCCCDPAPKDLEIVAAIPVAPSSSKKMDENFPRVPQTRALRFFFVGDAAGRPSDHSTDDLRFAANVGIPFVTSDVFFRPNGPKAQLIAAQLPPPAPSYDFDPRTLKLWTVNDELVLQSIQQAKFDDRLRPSHRPPRDAVHQDDKLCEENSAQPCAGILSILRSLDSIKQPHRRIQEVVLLVGPPACGKSTLARRFFPRHHVVCQDVLGSTRHCNQEFFSALGKGFDIIVDNTLRTPEARKPYLETVSSLRAKLKARKFPSSSPSEGVSELRCALPSSADTVHDVHVVAIHLAVPKAFAMHLNWFRKQVEQGAGRLAAGMNSRNEKRQRTADTKDAVAAPAVTKQRDIVPLTLADAAMSKPVPAIAIHSFYKDLSPPIKAEGFDEVYSLTLEQIRIFPTDNYLLDVLLRNAL